MQKRHVILYKFYLINSLYIFAYHKKITIIFKHYYPFQK